MIGKVASVALSAALLMGLAGHASAGDSTLEKIWARGKIIIGAKADYKPWGYRDSSGAIVGMEADMAQDVADALGVELELVPVQSSNRMQFLEQGKIDMMIATMSDRADRRKVVGIPEPNYYSSGTNVMAAKSHGFTDWEQLRDKPVCGKQGAFYNKIVEKRYGVNVVAFVGNAEAKQALKDKKCVAWVYDDSSIMSDLSDPAWADYEMPMPTEDATPWALAVPVDEVDKAFGVFMSGMTYRWHASGRLVELEQKWGIQPTAYLKEMNAKYEYDGSHLSE